MSDTGAHPEGTREQIEAAVQRRLDATSWNDKGKSAYQRPFRVEAEQHAHWLVDSDHAIVRRSDVAAVVEFVNARLTAPYDTIRVGAATYAVTPDVLARLAAVRETEDAAG